MKTLLAACSAVLVSLTTTPVTQAVDWQVRQSPVDEHLYGITYGRGIYVAVGNHRTILTSSNGVRWTLRAHDTNGQDWLCSVAHGNGTFVAVGNGYQKDWPLSSPSTWGPPGSAGFSLNTNAAPIIVSRNGIHWRALWRGRDSLSTVVFGRGRFVAVGVAGSILNSSDGYHWSGPSTFYKDGQLLPAMTGYGWNYLPPAPTQLAYGNGLFIIRSWRGPTAISTNGVDWNIIYQPASCQSTLNLLTFASGRFVVGMCGLYADGEWYLGRLAVSARGTNWSDAAALSINMTVLGRGRNGGVVAGGRDAQGQSWIRTSSDGLDWSAPATATTAPVYGVATGLRGVVAVGAEGLIMRSPFAKKSLRVIH
jgi:hypothetical protein